MFLPQHKAPSLGEQSCQFCPSVPQAIFLDKGGFLNFTELRLPQLYPLKEAASIIAENGAIQIWLPELASEKLLLRLKKMSSLRLALYSFGSSLT